MAGRTKVKKNYASILFGEIHERADADTPNAISRVNKEEKTVYYIKHDSWVGKITGITLKKDDKFGDQYLLDMEDGTEAICISIQCDSIYGNLLIMRLGGIDFSRPIEFEPWQRKIGDKNKSGLKISQENLETGKWDVIESVYHQNHLDGDGNPVYHEKGYIIKDVKPNCGLPVYQGAYDKDRWKIHAAQVLLFLKEQFQTKIKPWVDAEIAKAPSTAPVDTPPANEPKVDNRIEDEGDGQPDGADDLPF